MVIALNEKEFFVNKPIVTAIWSSQWNYLGSAKACLGYNPYANSEKVKTDLVFVLCNSYICPSLHHFSCILLMAICFNLEMGCCLSVVPTPLLQNSKSQVSSLQITFIAITLTEMQTLWLNVFRKKGAAVKIVQFWVQSLLLGLRMLYLSLHVHILLIRVQDIHDSNYREVNTAASSMSKFCCTHHYFATKYINDIILYIFYC